MDHSIDGFWLPRFNTQMQLNLEPLDGWSFGGSVNERFVEPSLIAGAEQDFGTISTETAPIVLIAAPGAVGKTTFSQQICSKAGAIRIDLSRTGAIGDNFVVGGLHKAGAYDAYRRGDVGLVIDGLDEARLKVSVEGVSAFLADVLSVAKDGRRPIAIFGRVGSIEEAWLLLKDMDVSAPVLTIDFFDEDAAHQVATGALADLREKQSIRAEAVSTADDTAVRLLLERLRQATWQDGRRFVGYAPVLQAVAKQVAAYDNPQELVGRLSDSVRMDLEGVVVGILEREQTKVDGLPVSNPDLRGKLYTPNEQITRLLNRLFNLNIPINLPAMDDAERQAYETALASWVPDHPFLDGQGTGPASAVFEGYLAARGLQEGAAAAHTVRVAFKSKAALPNPFLSAFFLPTDWDTDSFVLESLEDVPMVYASFAASVPGSDRVALSITGDEDEDEVDIEMTWTSENFDGVRVLLGRVEASNTLSFGHRLSNIDVDAENLVIEVGNGVEVILSTPVAIRAKSLILNGHTVIVDVPPSGSSREVAVDTATMENVGFDARIAQLVSADPLLSNTPPSIRVAQNVELSVTWPEARAYPWTDYAVTPSMPPLPEFDEAYGRLRKIVMPFKSDKYGNLAKYRKFVDHQRRTKGSGRKVRDHLLRTGVISVMDYRFYKLDAGRLETETGLTRDMLRRSDANERTVELFRAALA